MPSDDERLLPLFPLGAVLFPGGLLGLKIFEARYLDLVSACLREQRPFGLICLRQGTEAGRGAVALESVGTLAHIDEVDSEQAGILRLRCTGGSRFALAGAPSQQADGLWTAPVAPVEAGHRSATVCHLGNIAMRLKRKLRWDPARELFVGDDEANGMLTRPMREPWSL